MRCALPFSPTFSLGDRWLVFDPLVHAASYRSRGDGMLLTNGGVLGAPLATPSSLDSQTSRSSIGIENPGWAALPLVGIKQLKVKGG